MRIAGGIVTVGVLLLAALMPARSAEVIDAFDTADLDTNVWNKCQSRDDQLELKDVDDNGATRHVLRYIVDDTTGNTDTCATAVAAKSALVGSSDPEVNAFFATDPRNGEDLGPSFIPPPEGTLLEQQQPSCPHGGDFQRNELRFRNAASTHDWSVPHWYSLTFHAEGSIFPCGSARWVVGQWKQETGDSPVLAQRLDNGVLHVTVQDHDCRCMIAKAGGDPDAVAVATLHAFKQVAPTDLKEVAPLKCINSTVPSDQPEKLCTPQGLVVLTVGGLSPPELPDPRTGWVTMTYRVKAGKDGQIDVYANGQFIVRASGQIGYEEDHPGPVKFKIGHYRDAVPGSVVLGVDRLCVSETAELCDQQVKPVP